MQSEQDTTPTVEEMLRMGVTPDTYGNPQPWDVLIQEPPKGDLRHTARLLINIDKPKAQDFIVRLAQRAAEHRFFRRPHYPRHGLRTTRGSAEYAS